jgi:subtilase family serine protease
VQRRLIGRLATVGMSAATALTIGGAATAVSVAPAVAGAGPIPLAHLASHAAFATPPTTSQCEAAIHLACYSPQQFQTAYDMGPLYSNGLTGTGQTIVIVESYGYQNIASELQKFDKAFNLPAPPNFSVLQPEGPIPPFDASKRPMMVGWAEETSLDVEYAHAMAPGANILLVETPVAETLGLHGFPTIVAAENYVIDHGLGNVITQSFGAPEPTFPDAKSILKNRSAFENAAAHGVTVLASSGDAGPTGAKTLTSQGFADTYFTRRVAEWPADDPLVTGVGGTQLHLTDSGQRIQSDTVWNDTNLFDSPAAGAGGLSTVFDRPAYQDGVSRAVGSARGFPDLSLSAAVDGAALVYLDAPAAQGPAGFYLIGGTSEASPLFSGVIAIADQLAGHGLGLINPALYSMAASNAAGFVDVTGGTNTVTFPQDGANHTVKGWDAVNGYDLASGLGTIDGANFVPELVEASGS